MPLCDILKIIICYAITIKIKDHVEWWWLQGDRLGVSGNYLG